MARQGDEGQAYEQTTANGAGDALRPQSPALKLTLCRPAGVELLDLGQFGRQDKLEGILTQQEAHTSGLHAERSQEEVRMSSPDASDAMVTTGAQELRGTSEDWTERPAAAENPEKEAWPDGHRGGENVENQATAASVLRAENEGELEPHSRAHIPIEIYNGLMETMGVDVDGTPDAQPIAPDEQAMFRGASTVKVFWSAAPSPYRHAKPWLLHRDRPATSTPGFRAHIRPSTTSPVRCTTPSRHTGVVGGRAVSPVPQIRQPVKFQGRPFSHGAQERGAGKTLLLTLDEYTRRRRTSAVTRNARNLAPPSESLRNGIAGTRTATICRSPIPRRRTQSALDRHRTMDVEGHEWSVEAGGLLHDYRGVAAHRPAELSSVKARSEREIGPARLSAEWHLARKLAGDEAFNQPSKSVQIAAKKACGLRKGAGTIAGASLYTTSYRGVYEFLNRHSGDLQQLDLRRHLPEELKTWSPHDTFGKRESRHRSASAPLWRDTDFDVEPEPNAEDGLRAREPSPISNSHPSPLSPVALIPSQRIGSPLVSPAPTAFSSHTDYSHVQGRALHPENDSPLPRSPMLMRGGHGSFMQVDCAGGRIGDLLGPTGYLTSGGTTPLQRDSGTNAAAARAAQGTMPSGMVAHAARTQPELSAWSDNKGSEDLEANSGSAGVDLIRQMKAQMIDMYTAPTASAKSLPKSPALAAAGSVATSLARRLHQRRRLEVPSPSLSLSLSRVHRLYQRRRLQNAIHTQPIYSSKLSTSTK